MSDNPLLSIDLTRLDPAHLAEQGVWRNSDGEIVSRVGVLASIYFADGYRHEKRSGMIGILDEYLRLFPEGITRYQREDERRMRVWDGDGVPVVYRELMHSNDRKTCLYLMMDGKQSVGTDDPGLYHFMAFGYDGNATWSPLSVIKCHFPLTFLHDDVDGFVERLRRWCGLVGCLHGSCGLSALSSSGTELQTEPSHYFLLKRYPGLEYDAVGSYLARSADSPDQGWRRPRSSNWLTMVGNDNLNRLEGRAAIRDGLATGLTMLDYDGGALIRAGRLPQWGNGSKAEIPALYKSAAAIIKPIRFEDYDYGFMNVPDPLDYTAESLAWLRRFD